MSDDFKKFYEAVYSQDYKGEAPSGWIQWQGTDVCADMRCSCGALGHIDGEFAFYYECALCHRKYALGQTIKLIELTDEQTRYATTRHGFHTDDSVVDDAKETP